MLFRSSKIATAKVEELISTRYKGKNYEYTLIDALEQQGYEKGKDFETVFNYDICQNFIKKLANIKEYKEPEHNIKVGDIFYNSWGYEQTNIDFYQVVKATKKTITLTGIKETAKEYNMQGMNGTVVPLKDNFVNDKEIRKTPYLFNGEWYVNFEYGIGKQWEGKEVGFTCYA